MRKVYVIIGASSGIGYATAMQLISNHTLILGSRNIEKSDIEAIKINIDITDESSIKRFFDKIGESYSHIDGLVNCAGYANTGNICETKLSEWEKIMSVNLTGVFLCIKHAAKLLRGGRVVNISSTSGVVPRLKWTAYSVSKSGLISLSALLAEEFNDIKVFTICPGRTATPMRKVLVPDEDQSLIMQPEKVAEIISMCVEGKLDVLKNQILKVNGK